MVYRRTHQVVKRLAARRSAILAAARDAAAEGGMAAVQIAPVAIRANVAAGTVYRYFPCKADLISELIAEVSRDELAAIRRAADAAGPSSALAAAVTTVAVHVLSQRKLAWAFWPSRSMWTSPRRGWRAAARSPARSLLGSRLRSAPDICPRRTRLSPQPRCLARCINRWSGPWHRIIWTPPRSCATPIQTVTLLAAAVAVGVMDARARGLVVQAVLPAKALVGA